MRPGYKDTPTALWTLVIAVAFTLTLVGCSPGGGRATQTSGSPLPTMTTPPGQPAGAAAGVGRPANAGAPGQGQGQGQVQGFPDVVSVAERVRPATVLVQNLVQGRGRGGQLPGQPGQGGGGGAVPQGSGTGFIYDPAGFIITNDHVVRGAERLRVQLPPPDGRSFDAQLVGSDRQTDLAVLKIDAPPGIPTVPLGNSSALRVGEWVVAIGNALALPGGPTVTAGVVSALNREVEEPGSQPGAQGPTLYDLIQTDAAINPGNSGGPLVNLRGEVIGVNTLGATDANTIGFAVSIDGAKLIVEQIRQNGRVIRGYFGINSRGVTEAIATEQNLSRSEGVVITRVGQGTPAAAAGLQQGDIILAINDLPVLSQRDLQIALTSRFRPGETVDVRIVRGNDESTIRVTLGERPQQ
ncbi:MAG: trypsin-like peptidase domain-containing protein [Chloroflexota bacterium]|nr:trypsin-like peptidase domain-containing protein [Chloroflexota bacterium]